MAAVKNQLHSCHVIWPYCSILRALKETVLDILFTIQVCYHGLNVLEVTRGIDTLLTSGLILPMN